MKSKSKGNEKKKRYFKREREIEDEMKEVFGKKQSVYSYKKIGIAIIAVTICITLFAYFFIISPVFVEKPVINKPLLGDNVSTEQVEWMVNELGGYKLHSSLSGEEPVIEVVVDDVSFTVLTVGNNVVSYQTPSTDPDIRLVIDAETFALLYNADDISKEAARLHEAGKIEVVLLKNINLLAEKGYMTIYDVVAG